ncbi:MULTISPECIES: GNAT family N-acetyltransferase [unclassified Acinetobacter]|uniref:GNAT family N-acetyltransferase n=1 Tax=unclassified Acinetobacter TaxID=196816 RepID=UPI000991AA6F|nr:MULTISPECIES: GNAT family N-acetyltransferase [unclassified Acinetobacter]OOV82394.1 GNAT family N-acetyltransferase [Acinetobacter sp. ANC 5600]
MSFLIRPATPQDLAAILAIYNHEVLNGFATWNDQAYTFDSFQQKLLDFQKQNFPFVVIEDQDQQQIAGYADYGSFRNFAGYRHTVEHSVYIDPNYARLGLGQQLLEHLIQHAKSQNMHVMIAGIDHGNSASIALHKKLGFKQTGYMPEVGQKFGEWRDLVLMQLQL